jgi:nucleoside-diphosphate-sugar epimerase
MKIAVTGATGFLGRYIVARLAAEQHTLRCWHRATSDRSGLDHVERHLEWVEGSLGSRQASETLLQGCQALVHAALEHDFSGRMASRSFTPEMALHNIAGSLQLFEIARNAGVERIIYISSCAVHDQILSDRPLDETHPTWAATHYGAHKAAVEAFIHSYALGDKYPICALRPTGIYGVNHPVEKSKWHELVAAVVADSPVECHGGGKEVHAADVARAVKLLLHANAGRIAGEAFNCYDRYISQYEVASIAKGMTGGHGQINGERSQPKHQIDTTKLRGLGFEFGGEPLLEETIRDLVGLIRARHGAVA